MERKWLKYERETRLSGFLIVIVLMVINVASLVLFKYTKLQYYNQTRSSLSTIAALAKEQWLELKDGPQEPLISRWSALIGKSNIRAIGIADEHGNWLVATNSYLMDAYLNTLPGNKTYAWANIHPGKMEYLTNAQDRGFLNYSVMEGLDGKILVLIASAEFLFSLEVADKMQSAIVVIIFLAIIMALLLHLRTIFSPFKIMAGLAKETVGTGKQTGSDVHFVMDTYQRMIENLRHKGEKLGELYDSEKERADNIEHTGRQILDSIDKGIITLKNDGAVLSYNKAAETMLGNKGIEKIKNIIAEKYSSSGSRRENSAIEEYEGEEGVKILLQMDISDYHGLNGAIIGKIVMISDITEARKLEALAEYSERAELINSSARNLLTKLAPIIVNFRSGSSELINTEQFNEYLSEIESGVKDYSRIFSLESEDALKAASPDIIFKSDKFKEVLDLTNKVASSDSTVLITGESGTGKELIAREIHRLSPRSAGPFISLNCAALPETLLESELFGYVKGAFTGAGRDKPGLFKVAEQGSFFLDEVSELSPSLQAKILRVIQEREIVPVGGVKPIKINIRLIAATNRNLEKMVKENGFRKDLYYRLNVFPITIPPLRDRKDDIELLTMHFIRRYSVKINKNVSGISQAALKAIMQYDWPGNVRQLENAIERAVLMAKTSRIESADISFISKTISEIITDTGNPDEGLLTVAAKAAAEAESTMIKRVLTEANGNKSQAARKLKISYRVMLKKIKDYQIET